MQLSMLAQKNMSGNSLFGLLSKIAPAVVKVNAIGYSAAVSASEEHEEWQLALGLLTRMAQA